jgi:hypothetical protein
MEYSRALGLTFLACTFVVYSLAATAMLDCGLFWFYNPAYEDIFAQRGLNTFCYSVL